MNWFRVIIFGFLALLLTLLDVTFFSNLSVYGATIITTFIVVVIFALDKKWESLILFSSFSFILYSVFSSVPVLVLVFIFYILPFFIHYLRKNYFRDVSAFFSIAYFVPSLFLFDLSLMIATKQWGVEAVLALCYFVIINSVFGIVIYAPILKLRSILTLEKEIKI
jgi:hypothetical protein